MRSPSWLTSGPLQYKSPRIRLLQLRFDPTRLPLLRTKLLLTVLLLLHADTSVLVQLRLVLHVLHVLPMPVQLLQSATLLLRQLLTVVRMHMQAAAALASAVLLLLTTGPMPTTVQQRLVLPAAPPGARFAEPPRGSSELAARGGHAPRQFMVFVDTDVLVFSPRAPGTCVDSHMPPATTASQSTSLATGSQ